jgi:hypothetical protein
MTKKPLQRLSEFAAEVRFTGSKYLVVEGRRDRGFFTQWFAGLEFDGVARPTVVAVGGLEIGAGDLSSLGLNDGERSRVVFVAVFADAEKLDLVRCVADRDAGHDLSRFMASTLLWTDFPALESYGFEPAVLDALNHLFFGDRLPCGEKLVALMSPMLLELYAVRMHNEHMPRPDLSKAVSMKKGQFRFHVASAVPPAIAPMVSTYTRPTFADARSHSYGHDIGALLFVLFGNVVRTQVGIKDQDILEDMLRAAFLMTADLKALPLFREIADWAALVPNAPPYLNKQSNSGVR